MTDELKARIEKTMQNLRRNRMEAYFCENSAEARELVKTLIKKGDVISNGGSVTLKQTGIYDIISSADYNYLDRSREGITREEVEEVYRKTFSADAPSCVYSIVPPLFLFRHELRQQLSADAPVFRLVFLDQHIKRRSGHSQCLAGDAGEAFHHEAVERVKTKAAPPNTVRLGIDTYCAKAGQCVSLNKENPELCEGCHGDGRICCNYVVCAQQRHVNRIKVIIINEELGY